MTKKVRIENADPNYDKEVVVEVWDNNKMVSIERISNPADLKEFVLTNSSYLVIKEKSFK